MSEERVRVLLVDDEASLRLPLKRYLEDHYGFQVCAAADSSEALHLVADNQGRYDVALIDEVLQLDPEALSDRADGIYLMQQIKARYPDVETIIFTGWGRESRQRAIQAGAFRYVEKPYDYGELAMVIRTAAQQVRLRTISRDILSEKDPDRVLDSIMVAACSLSLADEAAIVLLDQTSNRLRVHPRTHPAEPRWRKHFAHQALSREIIQRGQVVRIPDTSEDSRVNPEVRHAGIQAFLGLPIPGQKGNLGALYVYSRRQRSFEEWGTVAVLQTLAGQAGLAFANAQAFQQIDTHARYMDALVRAGQGLTQATRMEDQLALTWDFVREQLRTSTFLVALYYPHDRVLRFPLAYDDGEPVAIPDKQEGEDWDICGHVIRAGVELAWSTDEEKRQQCRALGIKTSLVGKPCQSCIYLPLRIGDEAMGVISIQSYTPHAFTPALLDAFRALGSQLAVALENVRLLSATRQSADQISALNQVVLKIGEERDRQALLRKVIEQAISLLGVKGGGVYLLNPTRERLTLTALIGLSPGLEGQKLRTDEGLSGEVLRMGSALWVPDYYQWEKRLEFLDDKCMQGVAGAPIKVGERILGTLVVHDTRAGRQFSDVELKLLQQLANHAGLALQKAAMVEKLQAIQAVSAIITSSLDPQEVLQRACQAAVELFEADHCGLVLFDRILEWGRVAAEYPSEPRTVGEQIPVKGIPGEEKLVRQREPLVISDVQGARSELGPVSDILTRLGIQSIAIVPIVYKGQVLGSFSLDSVGRVRDFVPDEVDLSSVFAAHVAVAVENARLFAELAEAKEWQEALIENAFDAVVAIDHNKKITVFNRRAEEMLGWKATEMVGHTVSRLHVDVPKARELLDLISNEGTVSDWEVELKHRDGDRIPGLLSATLIRDSCGNPVGQAGFIQDLRRSHLLEDRLRAMIRVNKAITETLDLDHLFQAVIESAMMAFPAADAGSLHLYDEQTGLLRIQASTFSSSQAIIEASQFRVGEGIAGWVFQRNQATVVDDVEKDARHKALEASVVPPHRSMICVPLRVRNQAIGTLSLDSMIVRNAFQTEDLGLLSTFADQAGIAITNAQLYKESQESKAYLQSLYQASSALISAQEPEQILHYIVEKARETAKAGWVSVILVDETGRTQSLVRVGFDEEFELGSLIRPDGLTRHVITTGEPVIIENTDKERERCNPRMFRHNVAAALCLPLSTRGRQLGVMWMHYNEPRRFPGYEVDALQLYVNQAAIAYDSARRMQELVHMRKAAEAMAGALDPDEVLQQIVQSAKEVLQSDSSAIWSYDDVRDKFIPVGSVAVGIPNKVWEKFRIQEPQRGRTAYRVMSQGYVGVTDLGDLERYNFLGDATRELLATIGVQSFQGIALRDGSETLGVLYVNYQHCRSFGAEDKRMLETFANHAALALKKARLLEQVSKARDAARVVAEVTVLEDLEGTLDSIVHGTCDALGCGAVTLYTYDQDREEISYPPIMIGVKYPKRATRFATIPAGSIVREMLMRDGPYLVEDTQTALLFRDRRFVKEEKIKSCAAVPLKVGERKVGVMFVNYRAPHRFTADELANLELFANQAAVAIRNAHLYQAEQQRIKELSGLYSISQSIRALTNIQEVYQQINESIAQLTNVQMCAVLLYDEAQQALVCQLPIYGVSDKLGLRYRIPVGGGIAEALWNSENHLIINDVNGHPLTEALCLRDLAQEAGLRSTLLVKLIVGQRSIGVVQASNKIDGTAFSKDDARLLSIFAGQAAAVIENAQLYERLKRAQGLVGARTALAWIGMASSAWRHSIDNYAVIIKERVQLLRRDWERQSQKPEELIGLEHLSMIERLATQIQKKPITPPLSREAGIDSVPLNALVLERARQLWDDDPYKTATLRLELELLESATVRASPEWLRRAFDILIDNALDAVAGREIRVITVGTRAAHPGVEVFVADTGPGIPEEIRAKLGLELIEKPEDASGLGMGLLMAQTVVQTYGGELRAEKPGPEGTVMVIWLPLENKKEDER